MCDQFYASNTDSQTRQNADNALKTFTDDPKNLALLKYFLENSQN